MSYNPYAFSDSDSEMDESDDASLDEDVEMTSSEHDAGSDASASSDSDEHLVNPAPGRSSGTLSLASYPEPFTNGFGQDDESSTTSRDPAGSRSPSPTHSIISISESLRPHMFKHEYGRELNSYSDIYRLPADDEEYDRMEKQHRMFIDIMGAKYPPPMGPIMSSGIPREKRVLDLGCGSGAWITDVARDFPLCDAVAVDLVPIKETSTLPPNLRSEVDDINLGLDHFYDKFDVVHARLLAYGIKDYQLLIERISRVLRPGGLVELQEWDFSVYDKNHERVHVNIYDPLAPPWCARFMALVTEAIRKLGGDIHAAGYLRKWITDHEAFENIVYQDYWLPVIPGNDTAFHESVYTRMRDDIMAFMRSGRPLLLSNGVLEADYDLIEQNATRELHEPAEDAQYVRFQCIYATKKYDIVLDHDFT